MTEILHLKVTGMTCGGCENAVTRVLQRTDGVERATASHRDAEVVVTFDAAKTSPALLQEKIEALGYSVQP